jgi:HEAT repeat protein
MMRMPRLGRGVYATLGLAILVLTITYGGMALWPRIEAYRTMRALDRRWHDASLSVAERAKAVEMLAEFGPDAAPYLLAAARDADGRVRERAYAYLAGLEPMPEEAVRICLAALKEDREPRARASAVESLGAVAYLSRKGRLDRRRLIFDALVVAGRDESPIVRHAVIRAMINADAVELDPGPWLEDSDRSVRLAAAEAILWLDPTNKGRMVPMLQAMILQANPARPVAVGRPLALLLRVDRSACRGLVPTFVTWLRHEDPDIRGRVVGWLLQLGPLARDAIPALEALLDRGRPADRAVAAMAIVVIDPAACERASACLLALLGDAGVHPRDRIRALHPLNVVLNHPGVPATVRDTALRDLRAIPARPGIHPEFGLRIRQFLEFQETARAAAVAAARRVSIQ